MNFFFALFDDWCWPLNSVVTDPACFPKKELDLFPVPQTPRMKALADRGIAL